MVDQSPLRVAARARALRRVRREVPRFVRPGDRLGLSEHPGLSEPAARP